MKRTVREWIEFLRTEENATFAIEDINGLKAIYKDYKPADETIANCDNYGFEEWLNTVPIKVRYKNTYFGGTLFIIDVIKS